MTQYFRDQGRALLANGYLIIPIKPGHKRPAVSGWQNSRFNAGDLFRYPDHGVGVLCGQGAFPIVGIDIDITHPIIGPAIITWCEKNFGATCMRVGAAPRVLMIYCTLSPGWAKGSSVTFYDPVDPFKPSGKRNNQQVEILGFGQQFVAYHIHPDTGWPYEWVDLSGGIEHVRASDLPLIDEGGVEALLIEVHRLARDSAGIEMVSPAEPLSRAASETDWLMHVSPKCTIPLERVRKMLSHVDSSDRRVWLKIGMGLHHSYQGSADALQLWDTWSQGTKNNNYEHGGCHKAWASFGKGVV